MRGNRILQCRTRFGARLFRLAAMDSTGVRRYPQHMRHLSAWLLLALSVIALLPAQAAEPPVLAVLEYRGGLLPKRAKIYARGGLVTSPFAKLPRDAWLLRPGDTLRRASPPAEQVIQFYQQGGDGARVVCSIIVKYARVAGGWQPAFLINPQPLAIWDGQKLVPVVSEEASRGQVQILKANPVNGDGFYPGFAFGFAGGGPLQIDAWEVQ